jgi:hypothetical protein
VSGVVPASAREASPGHEDDLPDVLVACQVVLGLGRPREGKTRSTRGSSTLPCPPGWRRTPDAPAELAEAPVHE